MVNWWRVIRFWLPVAFCLPMIFIIISVSYISERTQPVMPSEAEDTSRPIDPPLVLKIRITGGSHEEVDVIRRLISDALHRKQTSMGRLITNEGRLTMYRGNPAAWVDVVVEQAYAEE